MLQFQYNSYQKYQIEFRENTHNQAIKMEEGKSRFSWHCELIMISEIQPKIKLLSRTKH